MVMAGVVYKVNMANDLNQPSPSKSVIGPPTMVACGLCGRVTSQYKAALMKAKTVVVV